MPYLWTRPLIAFGRGKGKSRDERKQKPRLDGRFRITQEGRGGNRIVTPKCLEKKKEIWAWE